MRRVMHDKELAEKMKEAAKILGDYRKFLEKQIPEQWERWGNPFSIAIYELDKEGKWRKLVFEHKPVDEAENNPPLNILEARI